jgi:hexosaminidase
VIPVCLYDNVSPFNAFTYTMNNIVTAVSSLFANQTTLYYQNEVSVGADEVSPDAWTADTSCSSMAWSGLSALSKSHYLFQLLGLANSNIKISGWQQLVQNDDTTIDPQSLASSYTAHVWVWNTAQSLGIAQAQALAQNNYPTVLAFADDLYFDLTYTPDAWEPGYYWAGSFLDTHAALNAAKDAGSVLSGLTNNQQQHILGLEGTLWSENLMNFKHTTYMALPKMAGLAEAAWANNTVVSGNLNWRSLATRLGTGNKGFLHYLYTITGLQYRGYPNGISLEIP